MHTFTDNSGRQWDVAVDVTTLRRIHDLLGVDLGAMTWGALVERLGDPVFLVDLIYVVCKPQADEMRVSDEGFGRGLGGDAVDRATQALLQAFTGFFPAAKRRVLLSAIERI